MTITHPNWRRIAFIAATVIAVAVIAICAAGLVGSVVLNACEGIG